MAGEFMTRRDNSTNNVPVVGYNDGVDAQDIILFGACMITEQLPVDGAGKVTLSNHPVSIIGSTFVDIEGVRRGRDLNDDIVIKTTDGSINYYAGLVSPLDKTLKVYSDSERTAVVSGGNVLITYYKKVPVKVNPNGELVIEGQSDSSRDVNVTNEVLGVSIKSSDVSLAYREKLGIMFKKEIEVVAGLNIIPIDLVIGDSSKDLYITNIMCYYDGDDAAPSIGFYFDQITESGDVTEWIEMFMPPKAKGMLQLNLGDVGIKIPAGGGFRFRTSDAWEANTIHVCAYGWQYI